MICLRHNRIELALRELAPGDGRALLLLHGLGERSPEDVPAELGSWRGPVYALDFTGHGASSLPRGGGYTVEILMADADIALGHLGEATLVGRGLGAYVALLLAGSRPKQVRGALLRDGPGLAGGGAASPSHHVAYVDARDPGPPDPFALVELSRDARPRDYATSFVRQANQLSGLSRPISVSAVERPPWLQAVVEEVGVELTSVAEALAHYAEV